MKKIFILPVLAAAIGLGACSNDDVRIFDESAADRLENSKNSNFAALTADGGKWALEYFSNTEEPGYMFVVEFRDDKSVTITTDHKWIGGEEKTETSMFDVITDNGIVLTFNTYNNLFHIFSDPADITGADAPTNNGQDIDETGYGHEGDYEFMMMENDGQSIRLRGKKHALNSYLRHLPADTDVSAYLAEAKKLRSQYDSKRFPTYLMIETATGATHDISGLSSGIIAAVPTGSTNPYARTETKAVIFTSKGMRPVTPFEFVREDDSRFQIPEFTWDEEGALVAPGFRIVGPDAMTTLKRGDVAYVVNPETLSPALQAALDAANAQTVVLKNKDLGNKPQVKDVTFYNTTFMGRTTYAIEASVGKQPYFYSAKFEPTGADSFKVTITGQNDAVDFIGGLAPLALDYLKLFEGEYKVVNQSAMVPNIIKYQSVTNPEVYFEAKIK